MYLVTLCRMGYIIGCKKKQYIGHDFEEALCDLFPPQWLQATAKETELVKRAR